MVIIARGDAPGIAIMGAIGGRRQMDTTVEGEELWPGNELADEPTAHTMIPLPATSGEQMQIVCESGDDAPGGDGATEVTVEYLDGEGKEQTTMVPTGGTTPVDLAPSDVRFVNDLYASAWTAPQKVAKGHIRLQQAADQDLVYSMIGAGMNKSTSPRRMVPAGKTLYLLGWGAAEAQDKRCTVALQATCDPAGDKRLESFLLKSVVALKKSNSGLIRTIHKIPALATVTVAGRADAKNAEASCVWWGLLIDD